VNIVIAGSDKKTEFFEKTQFLSDKKIKISFVFLCGLCALCEKQKHLCERLQQPV
jgi:hypothetical protein